MTTATARIVVLAVGFLSIILAGSPLQAAELKLIDGEFRYYENDELIEHRRGIRALPDTPQTAAAFAQAVATASEDFPASTATALALASWVFEIEPDPDTDEQPGDPVCVVTVFEGEASTTTDGAVTDASASVGGGDFAFAQAQADDDEPFAAAETGTALPTIQINPSSADVIVMTPFDAATVGANEFGDTSGEFHFIALIGDEMRVEAISSAASAAVYPGSADAQAQSGMSAELQPDVLDCQLTLTTLVQSGDGSIEVSPEQASYQFGDVVEVTAIADEGWEFAGWDGDADGMGNPLTLTIGNNTEILASFERQIPPPLPVPVNAPLTLIALALLLMTVGLRRFRKDLQA